MIRYLFLLLIFPIFIPVLAAIAADQSAVFPPPTHVQNTPEARETVQPSGDKRNLGKQFTAPDSDEGVQIRVFKRKDGATIEEHSRHGRVYMIKVSPATGTPPYYLYDNDGDGKFKRRMPGGYKYINPPEWVIHRF